MTRHQIVLIYKLHETECSTIHVYQIVHYATFLVIFKNTVPKSQESQENPLVLCRNKKLPLLESDLVKQG